MRKLLKYIHSHSFNDICVTAKLAESVLLSSSYINSVLYSFRKSISFIWLLVKQLSKPTPYDYLQNRYKVNKKRETNFLFSTEGGGGVRQGFKKI